VPRQGRRRARRTRPRRSRRSGGGLHPRPHAAGRKAPPRLEGRPREPGWPPRRSRFPHPGFPRPHEATQDPRWLSEAIALHAALEKRFWDERAGGFFQTPHDHEALLAREKPAYDGAEPSGNSVAILNLLRLEELTGVDRYRKMAEQALAAFASDLREGSGAEMMLSVLDFRLDTPLEIVVVSPRGGGATPLEAVLRRAFVPNRIYAAATEGPELEERARLIPLLAGKRALRGAATAYVCRERTCDLPTSDPTVFSALLARTEPLFRDASVTPLQIGAASGTR
jgi:uncharacterized protein YyaL (SSP411 family)